MKTTLMCPNMSCEGWIYAGHKEDAKPPYHYICVNDDCPITEVIINTEENPDGTFSNS